MAEAHDGGSEPAGEEDTSDAAVAFVALREEVARLRRFVAASEKGRPDYTPTLGTMAASLARIEAHPAMSLTPQAYAAQVRTGVEAASDVARRRLFDAAATLEALADGLKARSRPRPPGAVQDLRILQAGVAVALGAAAWATLSGPIARALPPAWAAPEKMAAATLHEDRLMAAQRLVVSVDPQLWSELVEGRRLLRAGGADLARWRKVAGSGDLIADKEAKLAACRRKAAQLGRSMTCSVLILVPAR